MGLLGLWDLVLDKCGPRDWGAALSAVVLSVSSLLCSKDGQGILILLVCPKVGSALELPHFHSPCCPLTDVP